MVMLAEVLFALPGVAEDSPLPSVDLGVREVGTHELVLVSRRTDADWWALATLWPSSKTWPYTNHIQVFRSSDAGRSWNEDAEASGAMTYRPDFFVWYTPEVGLIAGANSQDMLRTADGGRTWDSVSPADSFRVYDLEQSGGRTWICGSSGNIYRSDDFGVTWTDLRGTPFNADDRCMDMSFLDPEHGWAVGMKGSLWATQDGGATWRRLETPGQSPQGAEASCGSFTSLSAVTLLTPEVAWVLGSAGRCQTSDGGKTWRLRPFISGETDAGLRVTTLEGGRRVITVGASDDEVPVMTRMPDPWNDNSRDATVMGDETAVRVRGNLLSIYVSGRRVRTSPLTTAGTGVSAPLDGLTPSQSNAWVGWKEDQVMVSFDQGHSWFFVGRVPEKPLRNVAISKDGRLFGQMQTERLFVSMDLGRTWTRSTAWLDAYDFAVAMGDAPEGLESPLHCVLTAPEAIVKVRYKSYGCSGFESETQLDLNLSKERVVLAGSSNGFEHRFQVQSRKLPRDEGLKILRALVNATTRQETPPGCYHHQPYKTVIEWSCLPEASWRRKVEFKPDRCGPPTRKPLVGGATKPGATTFEDYERGVGVYKFARLVLEGAYAE
ncbi:YCF48-related protein [Myxococcus hansupus]|nr:YCF48-related protein [Myxococcus hansupus]